MVMLWTMVASHQSTQSFLRLNVALLLSRSDVQQLLPMSKAIDVVEGAFAELANGTAAMPDRTVITDDEVGG